MIGLLHPGEDKKFNVTRVRDMMSWEDPGDDIVGDVGRSQIVEDHVVFFVLCKVGSH